MGKNRKNRNQIVAAVRERGEMGWGTFCQLAKAPASPAEEIAAIFRRMLEGGDEPESTPKPVRVRMPIPDGLRAQLTRVRELEARRQSIVTLLRAGAILGQHPNGRWYSLRKEANAIHAEIVRLRGRIAHGQP